MRTSVSCFSPCGRIVLIFSLALGVASDFALQSEAVAALAAAYSASDGPGANPDGNGGTVDVWTVSGVDPGRNYLASSFDGNNDVWAIWDLTLDSGGTAATHAFVGGPLLAGQSVSIDYGHNTNIETGRRIGIRLLDSSSAVLTQFSLEGFGAIGGFGKSDGGGTETATGKLYDPNDFFTVSYTIGPGGTYTATASSGDDPTNTSVGAWSGTVSGAIEQIQIFTEGGDFSDQYFDNLTITAVPEASAFLFGGVACALLTLRFRGRKRTGG